MISDFENQIIDSLNIDALMEEKEKDNIIKNTLQTLTLLDYNVFIMFYYNSQKIKDIAKELHISESQVKVTLHRIRKKIRKNLKKGGYDFE